MTSSSPASTSAPSGTTSAQAGVTPLLIPSGSHSAGVAHFATMGKLKQSQTHAHTHMYLHLHKHIYTRVHHTAIARQSFALTHAWRWTYIFYAQCPFARGAGSYPHMLRTRMHIDKTDMSLAGGSPSSLSPRAAEKDSAVRVDVGKLVRDYKTIKAQKVCGCACACALCASASTCA